MLADISRLYISWNYCDRAKISSNGEKHITMLNSCALALCPIRHLNSLYIS
jgi:hypothetical protein